MRCSRKKFHRFVFLNRWCNVLCIQCNVAQHNVVLVSVTVFFSWYQWHCLSWIDISLEEDLLFLQRKTCKIVKHILGVKTQLKYWSVWNLNDFVCLMRYYFIVLPSKQRLYCNAFSAIRGRRGLPSSSHWPRVKYSYMYGSIVSNWIGLY